MSEIWTDDGKYKPVKTIEQALWHLKVMRSGVKWFINCSTAEQTEDEKMCNKTQYDALSVAIDFIEQHTKQK